MIPRLTTKSSSARGSLHSLPKQADKRLCSRYADKFHNPRQGKVPLLPPEQHVSSLTFFPRQTNNFFQTEKIDGHRTSSKGPIKEKNPRPFISHPIENLSKNQQKTPRRPRTLFTLPPPLLRNN